MAKIKSSRVTPADKLRTLLSGIEFVGMTQMELASALGVSTRTLRRFKNIRGYKLASRTFAKISAPLNELNSKWRRRIKGKAWNARTKRLEQNAKFQLPNLPIQPIPTVYISKSGRSQTLEIDCDLWSLQQKIDYLRSAYFSRRFSSFFVKVRMPEGVGYVRGTIFASGYYVDVSQMEEEEEKRATIYEMHGPFAMTLLEIKTQITRLENAGRIVVSISIVENLPESEWKND